MNDKKEDEIYCPECGKPIKRKAVICPHCGVQISELAIKESVSIKSKTIAIVLAIFFSFWSWLYTYSKNGYKSWISFALTSILWISFFIMQNVYSAIGKLFITYGTWYWLAYLVGIWLWAVLDNMLKPKSFYENYPKG